MKQWFLAFRPHILGSNGANPLHNPSLKNKKPLMKPRWKNTSACGCRATPVGVGTSLTALIASVSTPSWRIINTTSAVLSIPYEKKVFHIITANMKKTPECLVRGLKSTKESGNCKEAGINSTSISVKCNECRICIRLAGSLLVQLAPVWPHLYSQRS